jgi:hypothetical protein
MDLDRTVGRISFVPPPVGSFHGQTIPTSMTLAGTVRRLIIGCAGASLLCGVLLLTEDAVPGLSGFVKHSWVAASVLLLAGAACLGFASADRARARDVIMRGSLGSAFILWGIQQLLPESWASVFLGDIVIVLFVVDLGASLHEHVAKADIRPS